jgi:hypothetical protein
MRDVFALFRKSGGASEKIDNHALSPMFLDILILLALSVALLLSVLWMWCVPIGKYDELHKE